MWNQFQDLDFADNLALLSQSKEQEQLKTDQMKLNGWETW